MISALFLINLPDPTIHNPKSVETKGVHVLNIFCRSM